ncbi:MAG: HAD family hydrolase, partial [Patescibacteria group bacterium]
MSEQTLFFFDLDGTLFDPDFRAFYAVFYNRRTFALIRRKKGKVILITGRAKWDFWTKFQAYFVGVSKPDVVVVAAGSEIRHRNNNGAYEQDMEWEKNMRNTGWDKHALQQKLAPFLHSHNHHTFPFPNTNAILVPVYSVAISKVRPLRDSIQSFLGSQVKTLLTEQLLLPNNDEVFSGYIMILPATSGKENAALYLKSKFEHARALLLFGDASIDIEMLTMKYGSANIGRFAVSPTPHARIMLKDKKEVVILEGSVPRSINRIIRDFFRVKSSTRNSPFRLLLKPFEFVIDRLFYPNLTADEISLKGLSLVQTGLVKLNSKNNILTKVHGYYLVLFGYSLDLLDGIRARQKPHLKSKDGQL